jgi:RHS repeat-associated protein
VLVTITDRKFWNGVQFESELITSQQYYAFGMLMPGMQFGAFGNYRYGFNGKENDNEVKGTGNQQDYGFRIYDPRIGKFLSVDSLTKQYSELTPYQFASNCPILGVDRDGLEFWHNKWIYDIWLNWMFGDPTGAKRLYEGAERKVMVETGQIDYQSSDLLTDREKQQLDKKNLNRANADIIAGSGQATVFIVQTSFDVTSSAIPVERGVAMGVEALFGLKLFGLTYDVARGAYRFGEQWGSAASFTSKNQTTTVLGTRKGYFDDFINSITNKLPNEANPGGYIYLDVSTPIDYTTEAGRNLFWDKYNRPFLDKAIERGDRIVLTDNPFDQQAFFLEEI